MCLFMYILSYLFYSIVFDDVLLFERNLPNLEILRMTAISNHTCVPFHGSESIFGYT